MPSVTRGPSVRSVRDNSISNSMLEILHIENLGSKT